jgi:uncharacterized protein (TIGR03437 family)
VAQMRSIILIVCCGATTWAQITGLPSTFNGSELYFSSPSSLRGSNQPQFAKIFRWSEAKGIEVYASRDRVLQGFRTTFYALTGPISSADGSLVAFTGNRECNSNLFPEIFQCFGAINSKGAVQTGVGDPVFEADGVLQISRNGRYALADIETSSVTHLFYDLRAPASPQFTLPSDCTSAAFSAKQAIADDGTIASSCGGLTLIQAGQSKKYVTDGFPRTTEISARGNTVVYDSWANGRGTRLYSLDRALGREIFLYEDPRTYDPTIRLDYPDLFQASVSDDGQLVLILARDMPSSPRQWLLVMSTDGVRQNWFGYAAEGYRDAVLSGDGRIVFAVTADNNRLTRTALASGETTEILPPSPWVGSITGAFNGGSLNLLSGGGFRNAPISANTFPAPTTLAGVQVRYNGTALSMVEVRPDRIAAQIPWEGFGPAPDCGGIGNPASPLILNLTVSVTTTQPGPFDDPVLGQALCTGRADASGAVGFHADWTPISRTKNPLQPGETITILTTGLGPVNPPVATGSPASVSPLSTLVYPLSCYLGGVQEVPLFAGLAPGLIGLYQVNLFVPAPLPPMFDLSGVACTGQGNGFQLVFPY